MRRKRLILLALTVTVCLAGLSRAGTALVVERPVTAPDQIVVLASHESERIPAAAALARSYPGSGVLLTVPKVITEFNCQRCPIRADWLVHEGVVPDRIRILPDRTENTWDEALAVLGQWRRTPFARLAVVTSPYHTRRSLGAFEQVFEGTNVQIGVYPATATSPAAPHVWWLGGYDRGYVLYEWTALAYYRLRFGVPMQLSSHTSPHLPRAS